MKTTILFVLHDADLYGATRSSLELALELKNRFYKIYFLIPQTGKLERELKAHGFIYKIIPYEGICHSNAKNEKAKHSEAINLCCTIQAVYWLWKWNIDIVHTCDGTVDIGAMAARMARKPHIWHIREFIGDRYYFHYRNKAKIMRLQNQSTTVIAISKSIYEHLIQSIDKNRLKLIYDGIAVGKEPKEKVLDVNKETITLSMCGSIDKNKGQVTAVRALDLLRKDCSKNIRLWIVGSGDPTFIGQLEHMIRKRHLEDRIQWIRFQKDLTDIREQSDISLVCSKLEGFGRTTVEAMLSKTVVIGANATGTKELIKDGVTGFLYEYGNPRSLAEKVKYVMEHPDHARKVIRDAYEYAVKNFSSERVGFEVARLYDSIMDEKRHPIIFERK